MRKKNSTALKLGLSAAAALALTFGAVTPAFAANVQIGPGAVAGFEIGGDGTADGFNYHEWHVGSQRSTDFQVGDSASFGECSVTMLMPTPEDTINADWVQIMKGFPIEARPTTDGTVAPVESLLNSVSISVGTAPVSIQIPIFYGDPSDLSFTTVRAVVAEPGTYSLGELTLTTSTTELFEGSLEQLLGEWQEALTVSETEGFQFQILGVGFNGAEGSVVESLSFGGDTYYFGTGTCAPAASPAPVAATPPTKIETAA